MNKLLILKTMLLLSNVVLSQDITKQELTKSRNYIYSVYNTLIDLKVKTLNSSNYNSSSPEEWLKQDLICDTTIYSLNQVRDTKIINSQDLFVLRIPRIAPFLFCIYDRRIGLPYRISDVEQMNSLLHRIRINNKLSNLEIAILFTMLSEENKNKSIRLNTTSNKVFSNSSLSNGFFFDKSITYNEKESNAKKQKIYTKPIYTTDNQNGYMIITFDTENNIKKVRSKKRN